MFAAPNAFASPGQNCTFPSYGFTVNKADGALLVVGSQAGGVELGPRATYDSGGHRVIGNVERGAISGSKVDFTIVYDGGAVVRLPEVYHGDIFEDGSVSGDAYDYTNPKVHWTSVRGAITCTN
jgi:hypothetical protein